MKTLYFDCSMGAAGDMLCAALWELCGAPAWFLDKMNALGLPGVTVSAQACVKGGIRGTHLAVAVRGAEEDEAANPEHEHNHERHHHHEHRALEDILAIIRALPVSERVRADAAGVYRLLAEAEGQVHGREPGEVHFHEAGALDAIADVAGAALLMEALAPERVLASPIHVGSGTVRCAHGVLPVPAPATAALLRGAPIYGGEMEGELCTPTGAAILMYYVNEFGPIPPMTLETVGNGMGSRDFARPNCLRALWGESGGEARERVTQLACNLDDMTPEAIGHAMTLLLREGALDVWTQAIGMKKNRPGVLLSCLCRPADAEKFRALLLRHTTTWGVRESELSRAALTPCFESVQTPWGMVRVKHAGEKRKAEYEDVARLAEESGQSFSAVEAAALAAFDAR